MSAPAKPGPICFRLTGIPSSWDQETLERRLKSVDPQLTNCDFELVGPFPDCADYKSFGVALLNTDRLSDFLGSLRSGERRSLPGGRKEALFIDKDFYDLTPLNSPKSPILADVVAITGLGGHAYGSWRSRAHKTRSIDRPMWLRDFLPESLPNSRIMLYGYNSSLTYNNGTNLTDYRRNFLDCLHNARRHCKTRPIIFIGHSLGGIVIIQTLLESMLFPESQEIYKAVRGILFFGTPHQGLKVSDLYQMVAQDNWNGKYLLAQLKEGSEFLDNQKRDLVRLWEKFDGGIVSFYETHKTKQIKELNNGDYTRMGKTVQLVEKMSAQLYLPGESTHPIESNHTDMVKFDSPLDRPFQTVLRYMEEWGESISEYQ